MFNFDTQNVSQFDTKIKLKELDKMHGILTKDLGGKNFSYEIIYI